MLKDVQHMLMDVQHMLRDVQHMLRDVQHMCKDVQHMCVTVRIRLSQPPAGDWLAGAWAELGNSYADTQNITASLLFSIISQINPISILSRFSLDSESKVISITKNVPVRL